jgi:hypothetical protein
MLDGAQVLRCLQEPSSAFVQALGNFVVVALVSVTGHLIP